MGRCDGGWKDIRGLDLNIATAVSMGLVIRDDKDQITLVSQFFDEVGDPELFLSQADGIISIPKKCILKQTRLATYKPGPVVRRV